MTDYDRGLLAYSLAFAGLFSRRKPPTGRPRLEEARSLARKLGVGDEFEDILAKGELAARQGGDDGGVD